MGLLLHVFGDPGSGWDDELVLGGMLAMVLGFLLWAWHVRRRAAR